MIKRILKNKLVALSRQFPVVTLTGPRQSGKTTLVKEAFPDWTYISLEELDNREFADHDPRGFLSTYSQKVVIDEAQRVPSLFSYLQGVVDRNKRTGQYILTGSQNFLLHERISQSLAGRTAVLKLLPLSMEELPQKNFSRRNFYPLLFRGFYPRLHTKQVSPTDWYRSYVQTYLERDLRLIKNIPDLGLFQKFVRLCAGRIGQILNLSSLAQDTGISPNTARSWISLLESSFLVFLLQPHFRNFNKRLIKMPKLYFYDSGLACYLLGIETPEQIQTHFIKGSLFESLIISELIKYRNHRGLEANCYYWRDKVGHEIDCLLDFGDRQIPIEIKSGETITSGFFDGLNYWNHLAGVDPRQGFLIYAGLKNEGRSLGRVISWDKVQEIFNKK
ncbi:MAG: AAA family ATPase [Deltaproteobacteria bacterium RBG_13_43_22]|nr:MAG: AAA family ATPase [Deltaproteobacteria bacterium RBG_13_43_22]